MELSLELRELVRLLLLFPPLGTTNSMSSLLGGGVGWGEWWIGDVVIGVRGRLRVAGAGASQCCGICRSTCICCDGRHADGLFLF